MIIQAKKLNAKKLGKHIVTTWHLLVNVYSALVRYLMNREKILSAEHLFWIRMIGMKLFVSKPKTPMLKPVFERKLR